MKLYITSDEKYPHLFIHEPRDDYQRDRSYAVPEALAADVFDAQRRLDEAQQAVLRHLRDHAGVPAEADIIAEHLDEDAP